MDLQQIVAGKRELWAMPSMLPAPRVERDRPVRPGLFARAVGGMEVGVVASVAPDSWRAVAAYEAGGAAAVAVPADELVHGGGPDLVRRVASVVDVPVLFWDVIVDPRQVDMAYACGADAVRVVASALDDAELAEILALAEVLGLDALVSTTPADVERALDAGAELLGLTTAPDAWVLTEAVAVVIESGLRERSDVERMADLGFTACVVDASLLTSSDPAAAVRRLTGVSR